MTSDEAVNSLQVMDMRMSEKLAGTARSRELFLASGEEDGSVRSEIAASWRRSRLFGVDPSDRTVPFKPDAVEHPARLPRLAVPVLSRFAEHLDQTHTSLALTDQEGRIVWRWVSERYLRSQMDRLCVAAGFGFAEEHVGTNGIGMALELDQPVQVDGSEHYSEALDVFCCTAAPLRDPITHRLLGAMNITCRTRDASELLLPMVRQLANQVETRLCDQASPAERALLRAFVAERRRTNQPLVSISDDVFLSNRAAAELLAGLDQEVLWTQLRAGISQPDAATTISLPNGATLTARCRQVQDGGETFGLVATIQPAPPVPSGRRTPARALPGLHGGSVAWQQTAAKVHAAATHRLPVLVVGESGVGKHALLTALADLSGMTIETHDAVFEPVQGPAWLSRVIDRLEHPRGLVVLRHVEALNVNAVRALGSALEAAAARGRPRLAATCTTQDPARLRVDRALLDQFEGVRIDVPPLRHRPEDVEQLATGLAHRHAPDGRVRVMPDALRVLERSPWPGNVRQLDHALRTASENGPHGDVGLADLPPELGRQGTRRKLTMVESAERDLIISMLDRCAGNRALAARALGMSRSTLYRRIRAYDIARRA